ncbi:DUF4251 domain-containing protein [Rubrolithibacter danxiaensis]|uniref:DUF4251 domain-containing protein n=1 Tax=Rubrolithibacter danxiaensis TaxID=3390805 RepID=UPI003BF779F4
MNTINKILISCIILLIFTFSGINTSLAQKASKEAVPVEDILKSKKYQFRAEMVYPRGSIAKHLTTEYGLTISNDSLTADLPYFGRAYTAPMNPAEAGIHFTATKFTYEMDNGRKKSWNVTIEPNGPGNEVRKILLTVFDNGKATLQVYSNDREPISYSGRLMKYDK